MSHHKCCRTIWATAPAAAVFCLSVASRAAPGRSPGGHLPPTPHRGLHRPSHLEFSSVSPSSLILRVFVFNWGCAHAWVIRLRFYAGQIQESGHGEDGAWCRWRCCPGDGNGRCTRGGRQGAFWQRRIGHSVPSEAPDDALQKVTFSPAQKLWCSHDYWSSSFF
jgi:hypothetical protein